MDHIRLSLPHGDYNSILYRFSYDKSKPNCMILETFNAFFYSSIALKIRGDASRVILQKEGTDVKSFINLSQTELRSKDLFQLFAARSLRTKKNQSVTSSSQLLRDKTAHVVDIHPTTAQLEILCRAPIHEPINKRLEPADGFYCCLKLPLPQVGKLKRLRLVSLAHDESPGFDLLLVADRNLLHWGLEWSESNNTLQVRCSSRALIKKPSESSDDAAPLQELFELIQGKRLVRDRLLEATTKLRTETLRNADQPLNDKHWMAILQSDHTASCKRKMSDAGPSISRKKPRTDLVSTCSSIPYPY